VVAFLHDIIITMGIFVIIGWFTSFEVDTLFVTALLTILAFSVNDTIVIFDRIRDNLLHENKSEDLATTVARGLKQCVTRTMHTTISGLIMLFALFFLGSESIRWFILALIIGTFIGTYSSYFVAAPLLAYWRK
jgi:preprotein translocase subunit SecF